MSLFLTADPHFMHRFLAQDIRGFESIEAHDATLVENYNSMIRPDDTVLCLGDFSLKKPGIFEPILSLLNGTWHLVSGNHDACWPGNRDANKWVKPYIDAGFASVQPFMRVKWDKRYYMLSHFPYDGDHTAEDRCDQYRLRDEGMPLIHGHTHDTYKLSLSDMGTLQFHVGLDAWNLHPVLLDDFLNLSARMHDEYKSL